MELYSTKPGQRNKRDRFLTEGTAEEVVEFINSVDDGCSVGMVTEIDLEEYGGMWGSPPDDWSAWRPYYYTTPTKTQGGFETLKDALITYVSDDESVTIID